MKMIAVSGMILATGAACGKVIDFETLPDGSVPVDDLELDRTTSYSFGGRLITVGFDTDGDKVADTNAVFDEAGLNGADDGFRNNQTGHWDEARAGFDGQLGQWLLRKPSDWEGDWALIIEYSEPVNSISGEIWDIDGSPSAYDQWRLVAYDDSGNELASATSPFFFSFGADSLDALPWVYSLQSDEPITKVEILFIGIVGSDQGFAFNNFSVENAVPGPRLLTHQPDLSVNDAAGVQQAKLYWSEPVTISTSDINVITADGTAQPVPFTVDGSGTQVTTITFTGLPSEPDTGLPVPLRLGDYEITVRDTARASANNAPIDGDNNGVAGGDASVTVTHVCNADLADPLGQLDLSDINEFINSFTNGCD